MNENKITNFPSISDIEEHIEQQAKQDRPKTPWTRWVIIALAVIVMGLFMNTYVQNNPAILANGKGSVSGIIVNHMATPVPADIFLLKSELSTAVEKNGSFLLRDIPSGSRLIVVAYDGIGLEIPVFIQSGVILDLGQIQVQTTQIPPDH